MRLCGARGEEKKWAFFLAPVEQLAPPVGLGVRAQARAGQQSFAVNVDSLH